MTEKNENKNQVYEITPPEKIEEIDISHTIELATENFEKIRSFFKKELLTNLAIKNDNFRHLVYVPQTQLYNCVRVLEEETVFIEKVLLLNRILILFIMQRVWGEAISNNFFDKIQSILDLDIEPFEKEVENLNNKLKLSEQTNNNKIHHDIYDDDTTYREILKLLGIYLQEIPESPYPLTPTQ